MNKLDLFKSRYVFNPNRTLWVGVEREAFITRDGTVVPDAKKILDAATLLNLPENKIGYELSACQLETRTEACPIEKIKEQINLVEEIVKKVEVNTGYKIDFSNEVGPDSMPLDVFLDPLGRYATISEKMPIAVLKAACIVIGTHIHIGMPNHDEALRVYNQVVGETQRLVTLGDGSGGKRMDYYRIVAPNYTPQKHEDWNALHTYACNNGFAEDPRSCWTLIRITRYGTIEFRMFGSTSSHEKIMSWIHECHRLCKQALTR